MKESREQGNFPPGLTIGNTWKMYADIHHFAAAEIKKHDHEPELALRAQCPANWAEHRKPGCKLTAI